MFAAILYSRILVYLKVLMLIYQSLVESGFCHWDWGSGIGLWENLSGAATIVLRKIEQTRWRRSYMLIWQRINRMPWFGSCYSWTCTFPTISKKKNERHVSPVLKLQIPSSVILQVLVTRTLGPLRFFGVLNVLKIWRYCCPVFLIYMRFCFEFFIVFQRGSY